MAEANLNYQIIKTTHAAREAVRLINEQTKGNISFTKKLSFSG